MYDSRDVSGQPPFGPIGTFNGFRHDQPVTARIDYIFLSRDSGIRVKKYAVLSDSKDLRYPSDHLPVFVELE
jgi:endonuclease/exonuclease/phosphatase family metal-dependent hydrolase